MIKVNIELDPVSDGIVTEPVKTMMKEPTCLVIGTNGDYRLVDENEAADILQRLGNDCHVDFIFNSPYAIAFNKRTKDYEYKGRLYKYATDKGEALKVGDYTLMDIWDLEDMKITLTCSNMSGLLVSVDYTSKQYFEEHESDDL